MYIDKTILIILLSISAAILAFVEFAPAPAKADVVIKDRDYQMVTGRGSNGGEDLYVLDARTGLMAVFVYDSTRHSVFPRQFTSVADLFGAPAR
jgi:hypothetical protein